MINWIEGVVQFKDAISATLVVQGLGYRVFLTDQELGHLTIGAKSSFYIHAYYRDTGSPELYGFATQEMQAFFEQLLTISGIGPKSALGILNQATIADVRQAIQKGDSTILTKVSGIGKKTAERIIVELRGKVVDLVDDDAIAGTAAAIDALSQLGYSQSQARAALKAIPATATTVQAKVKAALQQLGGQS